MNKQLTELIIRHIYENFLLIPSNEINPLTNKSLTDNEFLLNKTLKFEDESGNKKIWGCQISTDVQELKILCGDCSQEDDVLEYCLVVQLKDAPAYGVYSAFCKDRWINQEALIACTLNGKDWMECNTYLQATFLAGMEQVKDVGLKWNKCQDFQSQYDLMASFINYHDILFGENA